MRESIIVNGIGTLLGLPLGYAFAYYINLAVGTDVMRLPFVIDDSTWIWTLVLGAVFTMIGYLPVSQAVRRLDWVAALNVNE